MNLQSINRRNSQGFTLIELMMVVAVISILITVAIPGISSAKRRANEAAAITALRTISQAESQYRVRFGTFTDVPTLEISGLLDENFEDAQKSGYAFQNAGTSTNGTWAVTANPVDPGISGNRYFFIDASGVIRFNDSGNATATDATIQ